MDIAKFDIQSQNEPKKVFFDISWSGNAIAYYRTRRMHLPDVCPKCHQRKPLIAVRVITMTKGRWRYYITPVCQDCWENRPTEMNVEPFSVSRYFLCSNINP